MKSRDSLIRLKKFQADEKARRDYGKMQKTARSVR